MKGVNPGFSKLLTLLQNKYLIKIKETFKVVDWKLLVFLLLFLDVKLAIKVIAIVFIYSFRFNLKFDFRRNNSRLPLFYPLIISIGIINYFISGGFYHFNYTIAFLTGVFFWLLAILAIHQVKLSVDTHKPVVIYNTVYIFFIINAICSLLAFAIIIFKTGAINPYLYQGEYQKYFIGTGDYIKGISFDTSTTNAILNAFGVIYFLGKKKPLMILLCMSILLLTGSNITNILLSAVLAFIFIFQNDKVQKSLVLICFFLLIVFITKVSPQNNKYIVNSLNHFWNESPAHKHFDKSSLPVSKRPDSILTPEEIKQKTAQVYLDSLSSVERSEMTFAQLHAKPILALAIPTNNINAPIFQHKSFITPVEQNMFHFIKEYSASLPISSDSDFQSHYPGKLLSWKQTFRFFKAHPAKMIAGTGIGNFSSKVAFKTTGIKIAGSWPSKFKYISKSFLQNHLDLYLYYFSKSDGLHSTINSPASVYDQLITEYGLAGLAAYFLFYMGFFVRRIKLRSFSVPLIFLLSGIFFFDYWFEQLSIVILFELFLFLNIKETNGSYE
jgi:hypothetical protein